MLLIFMCILAWLVLSLLCGSFWIALLVHLSSAAALALFLNFGYHPFRASRFACWVGSVVMRVHLNDDSLRNLASLDPKKQHFFACEPHGQAPLHLTYLFAAHGGAWLPDWLQKKTVVMGHTLIIMVPFLCQLFQVFGVTFSAPLTVTRALDLGANLALCPSGLIGKLESVTRDNRAHHAAPRDSVFIVKRRRPGFLKLAAQRKALVVPVLSPNEDRAFWNYNLFDIPWLTSAFALGGEWLIRPFYPVELRIGEPIDTTSFDWRDDAQMLQLSDIYYDRLHALGRPNFHVVSTCSASLNIEKRIS
jgi:hypothetical protein